MKLLLIIICFSLLMACDSGEKDQPESCSKSCNQKKPIEERDLTYHPFYNTLYGTDCSIPEGTEVVHYPMIHPMNPQVLHLSEESADRLETLFDSKAAISYSSFNFLKLVEQYPSALVFSESFWTQDMVETFYTAFKGRQEQEDNEFFDEFSYIKSVDSYEDLHSDSLKLLSQLTGVQVSIITDVINEVYPATTMSSLEEVPTSYWEKYDTDALSVSEKMTYLQKRALVLSDQFNKETNKVKKNKLKEMAYQTYKEVYDLMKLQFDYLMNYREKLLFKSVENVISQLDNSNRLVIINYGAAHNFSDDFRYYNFYTLPYSCTMSPSYLDSHQFTIILIGMYGQFSTINSKDKKNVLSILFSEIMDRVNHLSEEGRKDLKDLLNNSVKTTTGVASSIEVTPDAMKAYLLAQSADSDQDRFELSFNYYTSLSESDRESVKEVLTEKLKSIRDQKNLQNKNKVAVGKLKVSKEEIDYSGGGFNSSDSIEPSEVDPQGQWVEEGANYSEDSFSDDSADLQDLLPDPEGQEFSEKEEESLEEEDKSTWESFKDWWNSW